MLYSLYVRYHIRKVAIIPSFYYGFKIFDHFFWHSESPKGFFEVQAKGYVIFQFWNQPLSELKPNRRLCIEESIRVNSPEVKVMNPTVTPFFILPEHPLHKGFEYLSAVHKSDYLRCYFMRFYGGGYSDIKHLHFDFEPYFKKLFESPSVKYAIGYR